MKLAQRWSLVPIVDKATYFSRKAGLHLESSIQGSLKVVCTDAQPLPVKIRGNAS